MTHKALSRTVTLKSLSEGDVINIEEYIEKLRFFKKYSRFGVDDRFKAEGAYIVDRRYKEHSNIGLHYFKFDILIAMLEQYRDHNKERKVKIVFDKAYRMHFELV